MLGLLGTYVVSRPLSGVAQSFDDLSNTPLSRNIRTLSDDALVHFSREGHSIAKPGVGGELFSFRFGDIKHLTPRQIEGVIGPLANGGQRGGATVMHVLDPGPVPTKVPSNFDPDFPEYVFDQAVPASDAFIVQ